MIRSITKLDEVEGVNLIRFCPLNPNFCLPRAVYGAATLHEDPMEG